jgi:hypothetical protein
MRGFSPKQAAHHNRLQSNICATILSLVLSPVPALASLSFDAQKIIMSGEMDDQSCVQRPSFNLHLPLASRLACVLICLVCVKMSQQCTMRGTAN